MKQLLIATLLMLTTLSYAQKPSAWANNVKESIKRGDDINHRGLKGYTKLMEAAIFGDIKTAELLLTNNADPNKKDSTGMTAIMHAAARGNVDMIKLLMKYKADCNAIDNNDESALNHASKNKQDASREYLSKFMNTIEWISIEEAMERMKKEPKKILIDVYTDWCGWCKTMDKQTFHHPYIMKYISENYYAVRFNAEQKEPVTFKGTTYPNPSPSSSRSTHLFASFLLNGQMGYPSIVMMDEKLNIIQSIPGFKSPEDMEPVLKYFNTNSYKTQDFQVFKSQFVGEIKK